MIYWYLTNLYKPDSRDIFATDWHVYHIYHPTHLSTHNEWLSTSTAVLTASICWVNRLIIFEIFWAIHVGSKFPSCNLQFRSLGHGSFTNDHKELWQLLENSPMRGRLPHRAWQTDHLGILQDVNGLHPLQIFLACACQILSQNLKQDKNHGFFGGKKQTHPDKDKRILGNCWYIS